MAIERRQAITAATWRATDPDAMDAAAQRFVGVAGLIAMAASVVPFAFALGGIWWLLMSIVLIFRPVGKAAISVST